MYKLTHILITLSLGAAVALSAQTPPSEGTPGQRRGGPGRHGHGPDPMHGGHPIVRALDTDKNRELSAAELASAPASLRSLDVNTDGVVSKEELRPVRPAGAPNRPSAASERPADAPTRKGGAHVHPIDPVMLALDANTDGALSASEITNATTSLNALDVNKDGKLALDELRPLPPVE